MYGGDSFNLIQGIAEEFHAIALFNRRANDDCLRSGPIECGEFNRGKRTERDSAGDVPIKFTT